MEDADDIRKGEWTSAGDDAQGLGAVSAEETRCASGSRRVEGFSEDALGRVPALGMRFSAPDLETPRAVTTD